MDSSIKYRISMSTALRMVLLAVFFEIAEVLVDWIPIAGQMIAFVFDLMATASFSIWFLTLGVSLGNTKAMGRFWLTNFGEILPIPEIDFGILLVGIILMIIMSRKEDREGENREVPSSNKKTIRNKKTPPAKNRIRKKIPLKK